MALRLDHINMTNIINQKFDITFKTASDLEKALGIATWNAQNKIRNKKVNLENLRSLIEYQGGFPLSKKLTTENF
ncbi:3636_t:CDS:2 [Dentiscutata heterogama]|uniref:3636_t:CDS:1 n=1 Tax=Dentiscutata heterogama TaxID=1316150 RepID=A0ACA9NJY3_9GLOM|nr:3636_t:CDS:2 [Dentiscutata heterogama]